MTKKLLLRAFFLLTASTLLIVNGGCTSKKTEDTQAVLDNADIEKIEADGLDLNGTDPALDLAASNEVVPSQGPTVDTPPAAPTTETVVATTETVVATTESKDAVQEPVIEPSAPAQAPKDGNAELSLDYPAESQIPVAEATPAEPTPLADPVATTEATPVPEAPVAKPAAPLKKITEAQPYQHTDGSWINTVYIARPKEKLADISMKIYGMDKSADLKNITENKYLKTRSVRSGDKIYYSSPNRPDDSTKMLSYYEDIGAIPETYVAKKGDNLKKVSTKLLGFDGAWKEVWSTNNMTSKSALKEGEMIRFWKPADSTTQVPETAKANLIDSAPAVAQNQTPPPAMQEAPALPPPPPEAQAQMPPPPPPDMSATEMPPPPPPADLMPPPAPEAQASAEVAKPRKKINLDEAAAEEDESEAEALDSDTMTSLGALGILVALMAYVIIRKKKQKTAQMAESQMGPEINA